VRQFCPDVKLGDRRVATCLREHQPKLSSACRDRLAADDLKMRQVVLEFGKACGTDVQEFCSNVEPGEGRVFRCLGEHQRELTATCKEETARLEEGRERVATLVRSCTADVESLCPGVPRAAGAVLACLGANESKLSSGCNAADVRRAAEAYGLAAALEEMTSKERIRESLEILQGIDAVAFSRSQVLLQYDSYQQLAGQGNASRILFNPQLVFGPKKQLSFQVKVPVNTFYAPSGASQHGLGDVTTALAWGFDAEGQVRQYLSLGVQWQTSAIPALSANLVMQPAYALAVRLARGLSLTTQVAWLHSLGTSDGRPENSVLLLEPILVANLPGRSFLALDTKLLWNTLDGTFTPVMKGVAGLFTDRQKNVSISAWYQASLTEAAVARSFDYAIGMGLAYYFDW
jgi:hypothetical protein